MAIVWKNGKLVNTESTAGLAQSGGYTGGQSAVPSYASSSVYNPLDRRTGSVGGNTPLGQGSDYDSINAGDSLSASNANAVDSISGKSGLAFSDYMGMGKLGLGAGQLFLGFKNYGLQKDALDFNINNANRNYTANATKYNNSVSRTNNINSQYGSSNTAKKLVV